MTSDPNPTPDDQALYELVKRYDEVLADGSGVTSLEADRAGLSQESAAELNDLVRCMELLEGVHRERTSRISLTGQLGAIASTFPADELPDTLGRFELRGEVGRGGCGVVLRAFDPKLSREVAIKIPRPEALVSDDLRERFLREARAAGAVDHPNIVSIYEVGEEGPINFIAAAYIPGPSLAQWLSKRQAPLEIEEAAKLVLTLAQALNHAHERGVVHRDIKPGNILLQPLSTKKDSPYLRDYTPKIADFGLAKLRESTETATYTGAMIGTPSYMAPEQAAGRLAEIGPATDIYALGAILFELLTRQPPLRGESDIDTLRRIVSDDPPLVRIARPRVPRDLEAICLKCLEKRPSHRYSNAAALAEDLDSFLKGKTTVARPIGPTRRTWRWARRRPTAAALVFVSLVSLSLLIVGTWIYNARLSTALKNAETERTRAEAESLTSRQLLYSAELRLAYDAWNSLNRTRTIELLQRHIPEDGQVDLREFAWHWLWERSHAEVQTLAGHEDDVFSVEFSPDGTMLATASKDGTARIWNAVSGEVIHILNGHTTEVTCVAFSPVGTQLATGSEDQQIIVWDVSTGDQQFTLEGHQNHVLTVAFSPDGRQLASGGRDQVIRIWNLDNHKLERTLDPELGIVRCIRYSPDGQTLAACDEVGAIHLWDTANWEHAPPLLKSDGSLFSIDFQPDGQHLVATGRDSNLYVWDIAQRECVVNPENQNHESWIRDTQFSPDGSMVANANQNGFVRLWNITQEGSTLNATEGEVIQGHSGRIWSVAWSPDNKLLATAGADKTVKLWNVANQTSASQYEPTDGWIWDVAIRNNPSILITSDQSGHIRTWDSEQSKVLSSYQVPTAGKRTFLALHPDKQHAVVSGMNHPHIHYVDLMEGKLLWQRGEYPGGVNAAEISPDGELLAVASESNELHVLDLDSGERLHTFPHEKLVDYVAFSPDGNLIATCSRQLAMWDRNTGKQLWERRRYEADPRSVTFSPDGQVVAAAVGNRIIVLVDALTGDSLGTLQSEDGRVMSIAFSPDGKTLAVGAAKSATISLWDVRTRQEICKLRAPLTELFCIAFSPDGRRLIGAGSERDGPARPFGTGRVVEWKISPKTDSR